MELYLNATSPYARVARIVAMEKGLSDATSLHWCDPWADDEALLAVNPVGRVPALMTDDGKTISEALLIAQYLDAKGHGATLLPSAILVDVLALAGLGQGLMEAAFNTVIARKHQGPEADESVLGQRRLRAIPRILATLEHELSDRPAPPSLTLGDIVVAVALDYLAFRMPEVSWPHSHPRLAQWHDALTSRASFRETRFS